jgi:hypothetical protein
MITFDKTVIFAQSLLLRKIMKLDSQRPNQKRRRPNYFGKSGASFSEIGCTLSENRVRPFWKSVIPCLKGQTSFRRSSAAGR